MKFTTAAIAASAAALVSASPCAKRADAEIKAGDVFRVMTIRSGSDFQYGSLQAASNQFAINSPAQNASCSKDVNYASFKLSEAGELFLNTENPPQQAYVDRSGMAGGVFQYTTGVEPITRYGERKGFTIDENSNLVFKDHVNQTTGFVACPGNVDGGYFVRLDAGGNLGAPDSECLGFIARALKEEEPVSCMYTQRS